MKQTLELARRATRFRAITAASALLAIFAGACNSDENLAPQPGLPAVADGAASDSPAAADSVTVAVPLADPDALDTPDAPVLASAMYNSGMRFGAYDCTYATGLNAYNLCNQAAGSWTATHMSRLRAQGAKVILNQGGYGKFKDSYGRYSPSKYYAWVQSHRPYAASWKPYLTNGTLRGVQLIDDRGAFNWGGRAITNAQIDEMAKWWKALVPGITTYISGGYAWNLVGYTWRYLDGSINQYNARYMGSVTAWRDKSVAAARTARTSLILSLNVFGGGKLVSGCYRGYSSTTCSMSPTEIRTYGAVLAAAPGICGLGTWKFQKTYQARSGVSSALAYVAGLSARRAEVTCKKR
jgi:hypothetical protein